MYCKIVTNANRSGDAPGCPWLENKALKSWSQRKELRWFAIVMQRLPFGKIALATLAVSAGTV
jgi:hypothetical protein